MKRILSAIIVSTVASTPAAASCPGWIGQLVFRAAWISPSFDYCEFERVEPLKNGEFIVLIKVVGESRITLLPDKEIWARAAVHFDTTPRKLVGVEWRDFKSMVPPTESWKIASEIIDEINK